MAKLLTESHLKEQIKRFKALPHGDREGVGEELLRILRNAAITNARATRIVDSAMESMTFCPTPAELVEIARLTPVEPYRKDPSADCERCDGTGYVIRKLHKEGYGDYEAAALCECRKVTA